MWETLTGWFTAVFTYLRPQRADYEAVFKTQNEVIAHQTGVIDSMQGRIDTMDTEFRKAMERRDAEIVRAVQRIDSLETSEQRCRHDLAVQTTMVVGLRDKVRRLLADKRDRDRIIAMKQDPEFIEKTREQVTLLIKEEEKQTRAEASDADSSG